MLEPVMAFGLDLLQPFKARRLRMDLSVTAVCVVCQSQPYFCSQTSHSHLSSSHQGKCILLAHRETTARSFRRCNSKKPGANDFQQPWLTVLSGARKKKPSCNLCIIFSRHPQSVQNGWCCHKGSLAGWLIVLLLKAAKAARELSNRC